MDGSVSYFEFNNEMRRGLSTVIISDPLYKELDDIAQRTYEGILAGHVVFIDSSADKNKHVFGSSNILSKFLYVNNRNDVIKNINILKENPEIFKNIVREQKKCVNFNKIEYVNNLKEIIKNN